MTNKRITPLCDENENSENKKIDQLMKEIRCLLKHEPDFMICINALLSSLGSIIVSNIHKKEEGMEALRFLLTETLSGLSDSYETKGDHWHYVKGGKDDR